MLTREVDAIVEHCRHRPCRDAHVPVFGTPYVWAPPYKWGDAECWCSGFYNATTAPGALSSALRRLPEAANRLGTAKPLLYSINAYWYAPGPSQWDHPNSPQKSHRDDDADNFIAFFTYLDDVWTMEDGPMLLEGIGPIFGPKGHEFQVDTRQPHRGIRPLNKVRGLMWARWSDSELPRAYVHDRVAEHIVPASAIGSVVWTPETSAATRLIVDHAR